MFLTREQKDNLRDAVEDVLLQKAAEGDQHAARVVESPLLLRRVCIRVKRQQFFNEIGDGTIIDMFERLVAFLIEHADEIIAIIIKVLPLFLGEEDA
jgi:hypothetical protein